MTINRIPPRRTYLTMLGIVGAGVLVVVGAIGVILNDHPDNTTIPRIQAGSGSAPVNTTYQQPAVPGMNMGATATWTTPDTVPGVTMAKPGH